jgi:hypothetical protein
MRLVHRRDGRCKEPTRAKIELILASARQREPTVQPVLRCGFF